MLRIQSLLLLGLVAGCLRAAPAPSPARGVSTVAPRPVELAKPATPLTAGVLVETIAGSYMGELKRCYNARLKQDVRAQGRVVVLFTVEPTGRLGARRARGVGRSLERCVERAMTRWAFPPARSSDGRPMQATFQLALSLTSG